MGCVCAKHAALEDEESPKVEKPAINAISASRRRQSASIKVEAEGANGYPETTKEKVQKVRSRQNGAAVTAGGVAEDIVERRRERLLVQQEAHPRISANITKNVEGEQIAAGWPPWLSAVAGEAIKGWIPRRADSFEKLDKIGQGTYSNVYKARDLDTGKIVALKKVRFDNLEPESVRFMAREIQVLRRLDHPNIVKLEGLVTSRMSCSLYLVFEYMEHDLAGLAACPGIMFTEAQVKCYLQQLLRGLDHCHTRGVLHRDIKGSNLLLDNGGVLKIADFGLATFYHPDQKQPLTSRVVTLWYRPPELLLGATEYAAAVDLWSTGCILAELLAGKPIMPGRTEVEQLHKIFKLCGSPSEEYWRKSKLPHATIFKPQQPYKRCIADTFKEFPASSLALLETLLAIEPADRGSAAAALKSEFFTTKPLACDPSSLPQYPPSKEFDAKIRDEEARRQRAQGGRPRGDAGRRASTRDRISKAVPAPEANAELPMSLQKRRNSQGASKSKSEKFAPLHEDSAVGFPMEPPRAQGHLVSDARATSPVSSGRAFSVSSRSGPQPMVNPNMPGVSWARKHKEEDVRMAPPRPSSRPTKSMTVSDFTLQSSYQPSGGDLSNISSLVAVRNGVEGHRERRSSRDRGGDHGGDGEPTKHSSRRESSDRSEKRGHRSEMSYKGDHGNSNTTDSHRREGRKSKDVPMGVPHHTERIFHSGPLLHPGYTPTVDYEEFLEEHERQLKQAARRASAQNHDGALNARKGWNHSRSNGPSAVMEKTEGVAESNGVLPNSGPLVMPQQAPKRSKSRLVEGVDPRESRVEVVDKDDSKHSSEGQGLEKVQEL